jgi:hypothetical protein
MVKKISIIFVIVGIYFIVHAVLLYYFADIPKEAGAFYNILLLIVDITWTVSLGIFLIFTGLYIKLDKDLLTYKVLAGGHVIIFTFSIILWSLLYNFIVDSYPPSYGRIFAFQVQIINEIFIMPFSPSLLIILGGIIATFYLCYRFHKSIITKIKNSNSE